MVEHEFDILNRRMEKEEAERHTYLMFAFTTTIAIVAALFLFDHSSIVAWWCIVPFSVIIPFQARISYSRMRYAKMEAYICVFYPKKFKYLGKQVKDLRGVMGKIISIIVNYELSLLSIALDISYLMLSKKEISLKLFLDVNCIIIFVATFLVIILATYTYPYNYFLKKYIGEYEKCERKIRCVH